MFSILKYVLGAVTDGTFFDRYIHVPNQASTTLKEGYQYIKTDFGTVRLFYAAATAQDSNSASDADKPCVILSPDPPNIIEMQMGLIERLRMNNNVVSFEIPGFGFSSVGPQYTFDVSSLSALIINLIDILKLKGPNGKSPVVSALTCVAGLAQIEAARSRPDLITHLVCGQTACWDDEKLWARRMSTGPLAVPLVGQLLMWLKSSQVAEGWFRLALPKDTSKDIQDKSFISPVVESIRAGAAYCLASVLQSVLQTDQSKYEEPLKQKPLSQRACILWGSKDRSHRPSKKDSLLQYFEPGKAQFLELASCGHFPDLEFPAIFAKAVDDVLHNQQQSRL